MKVEGRNAVYELLKTDKEIDKVLVQKDLKDEASKRLINVMRSHKVKVSLVDKYVIDKESESKRSQGFIAYTSDYKYFDLSELIEGAADKDGFIVILNEILDPHNLGSIIRVCECAGVDGLVISKDRSASVNDTVMRISAELSTRTLYRRKAFLRVCSNIRTTPSRRNLWGFACRTCFFRAITRK